MRIGGTARYYAEVQTQPDLEQAVQFSQDNEVPFILLGGGSNTVFADGDINAIVVRLKADAATIDGSTVTVQAGKTLATLINELADRSLDLSALTGIPGTVGGALFGNAGQGPKGTWIDSYVVDVTAYIDNQWKTITREECEFRYRESWFKDQTESRIFEYSSTRTAPIIWEATLTVPAGKPEAIKAEIDRLLERRIETQPHLKTAGSCFKALADGTPAWQLIEAAGLRGYQVGGIQVSEKHANFLLNVDAGTYKDLEAVIAMIQEKVPQIAGVEMRLFGEDGCITN